MLFGQQNWRFNRNGGNMLVPQRPHVFIDKAEHDAKEPKVTEEFENARRKTCCSFKWYSFEQNTYHRY
jgi:hypothetical protein